MTVTSSRRALLGGLAVGSVALAASRPATGSAVISTSLDPNRSPGSPNILLFVVDDLGWGEVGAYGQRTLRTPVLDGLAADGVRFTEAYATPTCAPTRASLLTGLHTGHARVKSNRDAGRGLAARDITVAEVLRDAGYTTGVVGKWGLGPDHGNNPSHPNRQGFDYFFGYLGQQQAHDYWPTHLWRNGERVGYSENVGADTTYAADLFTAEALAFLDRITPGERFFLDVSLTTPHAPNEIPSDAPYSNRPWPKGERNHAAQVTATDAQIGTILAGLAARGLSEDTVVLVVSDNGPHREGAAYDGVGSRLPHDAEFFNSNGRLRGIKRDVYEGGIRVPMIARVPASLRATGGVAAPGTVVDTPVAVWDLPATFAELAGTSAPTAKDSVSLVPSLRGRRQPGHDHLYWQFREDGFDEAVRFGQWKAVRHHRRRTELYQLHRDPGETTDVARRFPSVVRRAERLMARSVA